VALGAQSGLHSSHRTSVTADFSVLPSFLEEACLVPVAFSDLSFFLPVSLSVINQLT
jgi:hypothetical protein